MTNFGRHRVIVLLVAMLVAPAGVALADQDRGERTDSVLERIEQWVSGLWDWVANVGAQAEPNGEPEALQRAGTHLEPTTRDGANGAVSGAGAQLEPNG